MSTDATGLAGAVAPMRVAYLVNHYPKVSHSFIRREMLALERRGVEVHRFAARGWDDVPPDPADVAERDKTRYLLQRGMRGLVMPVLRTMLSSPRRFVSALRLAVRLSSGADRSFAYHLIYLAQACLLCGWLREAAVPHLHAHFGTNPAEVAMLAHVLGGPPYSFTVHGPEEFDKPQSLHLAAKIGGAAFVVAISSYGRAQLSRWAEQADVQRIEVVHCGLEPGFHAGALSDPPAAAQFVCVGRLCEQKGQLLLIEAVARLVRGGSPIRLVLAGDGELRNAIEALVAARGLGDHVRITGWIGSAEVRGEMIAARALVLPSFAEGLPVVLMEAMALRRPVVSTFVAGIPELVRDGEDGWLVPAGDLDALVDALAACMAASGADLARRASMARARVLVRHDVDVEAGKLAGLFARSMPRAT